MTKREVLDLVWHDVSAEEGAHEYTVHDGQVRGVSHSTGIHAP